MKNTFMIAAAGSGCGKTTITAALLKSLKKRGLKINAYKCGPDYIDPMFHSRVLGIGSKNLDLFFSNEEQIRELFFKGNDSDVSVVEGVMGLYDGISVLSDKGSSYDLAAVLNIPIILVVDAHGMGRSLLAVIKGFLDMDKRSLIKGVILNKVSAAFYDSIKGIIEKELSIEAAGYLPEREQIGFGSRYLGLKLPHEIDEINKKIEGLSELIEKTVDVEKLLKLSIPDFLEKTEFYPALRIKPEVKIALAFDEAFCFYYEDNLRLLEENGAELVKFSPLHDKSLPEDIDGLIIGGGYPELYAEDLSSNTEMRLSIRAALAGGLPSLAECGGFMYLHEAIRTESGESFDMVGVVSGKAYFTGHLVRFGYVNIEEKKAVFVKEKPLKIKGHEFHYYDSENNGSDCISAKPAGAKEWESSIVSENSWWGFAHLYYLSEPLFVKAFIDKCKKK